MKKITFYLASLVFVAFIASCNGDENSDKKDTTTNTQKDTTELVKNDNSSATVSKEMVTGTWKFDIESLPAEEKAQYDTMPEEQKKMIEEMLSKMTFTYNEDGTVEASDGEAVKKGTWSISEDGKFLLMTQEGNETADTVEVVEATENKLVLKDKGEVIALKK